MLKIFTKFLFFITFCLVWEPLYAADNLEAAIEREAAYIVERSPSGSVVAIVNIKSDSDLLSTYIIERIPDYVVHNNKNITFVDRTRLDLIQKEIDFQYSGEVSDETMVSIGKKIGAQIIAAGSVLETGGSYYNFNIKLINVETAVILGSNSAGIIHDNTMEAYLPHSQAAQITKAQVQAKQQKREAVIQTVKKSLGIFSNGFYLGYLGALNTPIGISLGWTRESIAFFMDNTFGPPNFSGYEISDDLTYNGSSITGSAGNSYTDERVDTMFRWDCLFGLNINIVKTLLWADIGAGFEYRQEYKLYSENDAGSTGKLWIKNGNEDERLKLVISAGLFVKIWYFYIQGKYKYVFGEGVDYSTYGLNHLSLGLGYVWRKN
ncbi:MAG: penicillin-binding protein activator LpoB [Treponema sp.]|jgi:hypothetical protein|nr:penicillin-binding protein activator LpoB [Treponema sp.]